MYKNILLLGFLVVYSTASFAQNQSGNAVNYPPLNLHLSTQQYLQLAAADTVESPAKETSTAQMSGDNTDHSSPEYKDRWLTANKSHKWLGLGSLALAAASVLMPKEEDGAHHDLAQGAAILGGAAAATGLVFHYDDLSGKGFFSNPDNWHAILATLGVVGYAIAVDQGGESGHAEAGVVGMVSMIAGIKMTW